MQQPAAIRWVVALKEEAIPIREQYNMVTVEGDGIYPVFRDKEEKHWLVISGIGKINAAAATMFLSQISNAPPWTAWINIGIAGHGKSDFGTLHLVDKIIEKSTSYIWYPAPAIFSSLSRQSLCTVDCPETMYCGEYLFDMEGSSFFQISNYLSCQQLVLILKIVSDGPNSSVKILTKKNISNLITANLEKICFAVSDMEQLSLKESRRLSLPTEYLSITDNWHFTQTRSHKLKNILRRWQAVFPGKDPMPHLSESPNAAAVIKKLADMIDHHRINWGKR